TAGAPFTVTVTALDQFNNVATDYLGTVQFTSSDAGAGSLLPADYTFVAGDHSVHTFTNGVTLVTAGSQTLAATATRTSSISSTATITVRAAMATHLVVNAPSGADSGSELVFTVTAQDPFNNTATGYGGTL